MCDSDLPTNSIRWVTTWAQSEIHFVKDSCGANGDGGTMAVIMLQRLAPLR